MTPEQIESLRRHAAEKVMGWTLVNNSVYIADGKPVFYLSNTLGEWPGKWRPDEDANQALMLLDEIERGGGFWERIWRRGVSVTWHAPGTASIVNAEPFPLAALIAVCRATGWQE